MPAKEFSGIFPYLVTPLDESGGLKEAVLRDLVNHLISKGVHGLTPLGSTGEGAYLDWPMKKRVVEVVVEAAAGRVPIVAGVNNMTTHGAVREAVETERIGVDGILVVLPSYFPVNDQHQVVAHFRSVARDLQRYRSCACIRAHARRGRVDGWPRMLDPRAEYCPL
jgi:4-hydroxy-tetrahydrodipicolinate synthase